jgi:hypothetical protein
MTMHTPTLAKLTLLRPQSQSGSFVHLLCRSLLITFELACMHRSIAFFWSGLPMFYIWAASLHGELGAAGPGCKRPQT